MLSIALSSLSNASEKSVTALSPPSPFAISTRLKPLSFVFMPVNAEKEI